jgi:hypothetical protein
VTTPTRRPCLARLHRPHCRGLVASSPAGTSATRWLRWPRPLVARLARTTRRPPHLPATRCSTSQRSAERMVRWPNGCANVLIDGLPLEPATSFPCGRVEVGVKDCWRGNREGHPEAALAVLSGQPGSRSAALQPRTADRRHAVAVGHDWAAESGVRLTAVPARRRPVPELSAQRLPPRLAGAGAVRRPRRPHPRRSSRRTVAVSRAGAPGPASTDPVEGVDGRAACVTAAAVSTARSRVATMEVSLHRVFLDPECPECRGRA